MNNVVICGYHGFSNSGDEALLRTMIGQLRAKAPDVHITVLSIKPKSTAGLYGVESVYRYDPIALSRVFRRANLLLLGGGSVLQDVTSNKSLYYYLNIVRMALSHKVKVMLYANGIGPLRHSFNRRLTRKLLEKVDLITLRDVQSAALLSEIGVVTPTVMVTADPAFTLGLSGVASPAPLLREAGMEAEKDYAVISVRPWKSACADFTDLLAGLADEMTEKYGIVPFFVPMQYKADEPTEREILGKMTAKGVLLGRPLSVDEICSLISGAKFTIGMRLHTLIYSAAFGVPCAALSYDPKVSAFAESVCPGMSADVEKMNADELSAILSALTVSLPQKKKELRKRLAVLCDKAAENAELAAALLQGKKPEI